MHACAIARDYQQQGSKPPQQAAPATQQAAAKAPVDQLSAATAAMDFRNMDFMRLSDRPLRTAHSFYDSSCSCACLPDHLDEA
jgi:hypothetical protein